jgi:MFS family permease
VLEKKTGRKVTLGTKIYAGIFFAIASQLTAAMFEYARMDAEVLPIPSSCAPIGEDGEHVHMSGFSSFWMAIPYTLIGIGEVLVNPVLQHYCYEEAPESMRSMLQALNVFAMGGLSNAVSAALSMATANWTPNDLNDGNLQAVYFLNIAIAVVGCFFVRWAINAPKSQQNKAEAKVEQNELTPKAAVVSVEPEVPEVARVPSWGRV